jgi:pimeloyl-ACP methyl ester carboxylesterase
MCWHRLHQTVTDYGMTTPENSAAVAWFAQPAGPRIAYRYVPGTGPGIVFLPGYKSDMCGSMAMAVFVWAVARGAACLLFDYSGCGQSDGQFGQGTLSRWRDELLALIDHVDLDRVVLVGSSMGGWLMLLVAEALGARVAGLVGIAAAPDFTEWGVDDLAKARLAAGQVVLEDNPYGPDPMPTYPDFWADGQEQRRLGAAIAFAGPVRLLHGQADPDVPWDIALRLSAAMCSGDVQINLIKDGDHRLSRPADIALLLAVLAGLLEGLPE